MKKNHLSRISLSFIAVFILAAILFYPRISCSDGEARFVLKQTTTQGDAPLFQSGEYTIPFEALVVSEGRYCGLEISFSKTMSKTEKNVLLFDLPCTSNLSVWEKWNAAKRERTLESKIKQLPLTLTAQDLTVPNEDVPPTAVKRTWSPKFYLERNIFDPKGASRSEWIDFGDFALTIKSFSVVGKRIQMHVEFRGSVTEERAVYTKGIYEIEGLLDIDTNNEIGLRMTD